MVTTVDIPLTYRILRSVQAISDISADIVNATAAETLEAYLAAMAAIGLIMRPYDGATDGWILSWDVVGMLDTIDHIEAAMRGLL